jgi:hypothetical protein
MEDDNFSIHEVSLDGTPNFQYIHQFFVAIIYVASQLLLCSFWISLRLGIGVYKHPCFKNLCKIPQASKDSDSNAQHFLSNFLTHSRFHSVLFALPGYQFPYTVMNRCFYLMPKNLPGRCFLPTGLYRPWCHIYMSTSKVQKGTRIGHSVGELSIIHIRLVVFGEYRSVCTQARSLAHLASPLLMPFITDMHSYIYIYYDYFLFWRPVTNKLFGNYKVCSHRHNRSLIQEQKQSQSSSQFCIYARFSGFVHEVISHDHSQLH